VLLLLALVGTGGSAQPVFFRAIDLVCGAALG